MSLLGDGYIVMYTHVKCIKLYTKMCAFYCMHLSLKKQKNPRSPVIFELQINSEQFFSKIVSQILHETYFYLAT